MAEGVVNLVDEAWKVGCDILEGFVCHQIHGFDLQCLHEALGLGVVVGVSAPTHRAGETVLLQDGAIVIGGVLRSTVGMMHATRWWIAGADSGLECSNSEPCIDRAADGVPYDPGEQRTEHPPKEQNAGRYCKIGDVASPQLFRPPNFHVFG